MLELLRGQDLVEPRASAARWAKRIKRTHKGLAVVSSGLTGPQKGKLRDGLAAAFPTIGELLEFAVIAEIVASETELNLNQAVKALAWDLVGRMESHGTTTLGIDRALELNSGNPQLQEFAREFRQRSVSGAFVDLTVDSFDLHRQEERWRAVLARQFEGRLIVFLMANAESEVLESLFARLRAHLLQDGVFGPETVSLDPTIKGPNVALERVSRHAREIGRRHVLLRINAYNTQQHTLRAFIESVRLKFPGELKTNLVLVCVVSGDWGEECACEVLPSWTFEEAEITHWINRIAAHTHWPPPLRTQLKQWLCDRAHYEGTTSGGLLYDTLRSVIEFLRCRPTDDELRDWLTSSHKL